MASEPAAKRAIGIIAEKDSGVFLDKFCADAEELLDIDELEQTGSQTGFPDFQAGLDGALEEFALFRLVAAVEVPMSWKMFFQQNGFQSAIRVFAAADGAIKERQIAVIFQKMQEGA